MIPPGFFSDHRGRPGRYNPAIQFVPLYGTVFLYVDFRISTVAAARQASDNHRGAKGGYPTAQERRMAAAALSIAGHGKTFEHVVERCPKTVARGNKRTQTNSIACVLRRPPLRRCFAR
jgi:hypothetical protein